MELLPCGNERQKDCRIGLGQHSAVARTVVFHAEMVRRNLMPGNRCALRRAVGGELVLWLGVEPLRAGYCGASGGNRRRDQDRYPVCICVTFYAEGLTSSYSSFAWGEVLAQYAQEESRLCSRSIKPQFFGKVVVPEQVYRAAKALTTPFAAACFLQYPPRSALSHRITRLSAQPGDSCVRFADANL